MKTLILIFLALFLNSCAVYIIKYDCPQRDTIIIKESYPRWDFKRDINKQEEFIWEDKMPIIEKIKELQDSLNQEFYRNFK